MMRLRSLRQIYCLCKLQVISKSVCSKSVLEKNYFKVPITYLQSTNFSTGNERRDDIILEADKDSVLQVYRGSISDHIFRVKAFSLVTSIFGVSAQPVLYQKAMETDANMGVLVATCSFIGFFTFITPILLHLVTKKYILSLEYCPKTDVYLAKTYSFFLRSKEQKFKTEEITIPEVPTMLTTFKVKGQPYFVDKDSFLDINHYKKIMGYDKPFKF